MRKLTIAAALLFALAGTAQAQKPSASAGPANAQADQQQLIDEFQTLDHFGNRKILMFSTMYGVDGPFVGEDNPIRDVVGDELPWTVDGFAIGDLDTRGHLRILVRGLVFADDPSVPPELVGTNDEPYFRGLVSCLTETEDDTVETQNVVTDGFPANVHGDSFIHATVELPNPCVAPIVMILAGSEDKWFAVTGFESEDEGATH
ncbi:MAG TPA: hypothetical protein VJX31_05965 [Casimicrobiaceae bacterium]|nr:hypothetical protein [Casimicrobiaceae bacterium]